MLLLPAEKYNLLIEKIKEVTVNNLFARSVIEKHVTGMIYVDNINNPRSVYVIHPYGLTLLYGDHTNKDFIEKFRDYVLDPLAGNHEYEWMQAFPKEWGSVLDNTFGDSICKINEISDINTSTRIEVHTRVNFDFRKSQYLKAEKKALSDLDIIKETDAPIFEQMHGSVIPLKFWDSAGDFLKNGKGFTLMHNGEIASTAYSAYVHDNLLEIGIETVEKYRGYGFAELTCRRLIDYCIECQLIPVWSCRYENTASYNLARKLGFEPTLFLPFFKIRKK